MKKHKGEKKVDVCSRQFFSRHVCLFVLEGMLLCCGCHGKEHLKVVVGVHVKI